MVGRFGSIAAPYTGTLVSSIICFSFLEAKDNLSEHYQPDFGPSTIRHNESLRGLTVLSST